MVLSFSGTGNSRYLAGLLAQALGDSLYSMNSGLKTDTCPDIASEERLVFVVPT